jgi:hypothetical protein
LEELRQSNELLLGYSHRLHKLFGLIGSLEIGEGFGNYLLQLKDQSKGPEVGGCKREFLYSQPINSDISDIMVILSDKGCYQLGE